MTRKASVYKYCVVNEMINYIEKNNVEYFNLVRFRNWIRQDKLSALYDELNRVIIGNNAKKCGPLISCTHFLRKNGESIELDFEIMVPIDKNIPLTLEFCMCDKFCIEKVLDIHVVTSKFSFEKEMAEINQHIKENKILPKTATYSVLEKDDNEMIDTHIIFGI